MSDHKCIDKGGWATKEWTDQKAGWIDHGAVDALAGYGEGIATAISVVAGEKHI